MHVAPLLALDEAESAGEISGESSHCSRLIKVCPSGMSKLSFSTAASASGSDGLLHDNPDRENQIQAFQLRPTTVIKGFLLQTIWHTLAISNKTYTEPVYITLPLDLWPNLLWRNCCSIYTYVNLFSRLVASWRISRDLTKSKSMTVTLELTSVAHLSDANRNQIVIYICSALVWHYTTFSKSM